MNKLNSDVCFTLSVQAYLEFFTSKQVVDILLHVLKDDENINYHVINCEVSRIHCTCTYMYTSWTAPPENAQLKVLISIVHEG